MTLASRIKQEAQDALKQLYPDVTIELSMIGVNQTKPEFTGDYTIVLFPFLKLLRQKPDVIGKLLGDKLCEGSDLFGGYEIVSGFLNLGIKDSFWVQYLTTNYTNKEYGIMGNSRRVMVEYSSPNTNKPLHFGHLRNIFLGAAVSNVLKVAGNEVIKANLNCFLGG